MTELKFKFEIVLCKTCRHFEDSGLKDVILYSKKGNVRGRFQVRFFCYVYQEYLAKLYSKCVRYEP
jgi:hypothetical protein